MPHMNQNLYSVVEFNTHASDQWSVINSAQAKTLTNAGLIVALDGCLVGGFFQPGSTSYLSTPPLPSDNIALAYLYGSAKALASMGDPFQRTHYANHPLLFREMKVNRAYLGAAHRARMAENYSRAGSNDQALKSQVSELLFGDPFMDLN